MRVNFQKQNFYHKKNMQGNFQSNISFEGKKLKRAAALGAAGLMGFSIALPAMFGVFPKAEKETLSINENAEPSSIEAEIYTGTRGDEEKLEEAKKALAQAVSDYEASATQWFLYGSRRIISIMEKDKTPDDSDFINGYKNLINFNREIPLTMNTEEYCGIGEDIKDVEKALSLIRDTVFESLFMHTKNGGYHFSSITALNDVSNSEMSGILNLLNSIIFSKEGTDKVKQAAEIYKEEILKVDTRRWERPDYLYKAETVEELIDGDEALKAYLTENADSIQETAKRLLELNEAYKFLNTTDGMSEEYKEYEQLYLQACEDEDFEAQRKIRAKQSAAYEKHFRNTVFPAYQTYYEAYNSGIIAPLEEMCPYLKYASIRMDGFDMIQAVFNAETRLRDEMGITSGFYTNDESYTE